MLKKQESGYTSKYKDVERRLTASEDVRGNEMDGLTLFQGSHQYTSFSLSRYQLAFDCSHNYFQQRCIRSIGKTNHLSVTELHAKVRYGLCIDLPLVDSVRFGA